MSINIFVDGSKERMDGYLALSIANSNIHRALFYTRHVSYAMTDILKPLIDSLKIEKKISTTLSSSQLEGFIKDIEKEELEKRTLSVEKNNKTQEYISSVIQEGFFMGANESNLYLNQMLAIILDSARTCVNNGNNMIITVDNHAFQKNYIKESQTKVYRPMDSAPTNKLCVVNDVTIDYANFLDDEYKGSIRINDKADCIEWIGTEMTRQADIHAKTNKIETYTNNNNNDHRLIIRPSKMNKSSQRYAFSSTPAFDDSIKEFIHDSIILLRERSYK